MAESEQDIDFLTALREEAGRQLDAAIANGDATVYEEHAWAGSPGVKIRRSADSMVVEIEYEERTASGKVLDLTVEVEYSDFEDQRLVEIFEERNDSETFAGGRKNIPKSKYQETAGKLLKVLSVVV